MNRSFLQRWMVAFIAFAVIGGTAFSARAAPFIPVTPADFVGSRSTSNASELTGTGNWANGFEISWEITDNLDGTWTYVYEIELGTEVQGDPSHFNLEVSPTFTEENILASNGLIEGPEIQKEQNGNPGLPAEFFGIKFDFEDYVYSLLSDRNPVWGDFYSKDGNAGQLGTNAIWNVGIGTDPLATDTPFSGWVPVPDSGVIIPIPAAVWLGLAGIGAVMFVRRRMVQ